MIAGTLSTIDGLKTRPDLNGSVCTSHRYDIKSGRYLVDIDGIGRVGVKGHNLTPVEYTIQGDVPVRDVNGRSGRVWNPRLLGAYVRLITIYPKTFKGHDDTAITVHGLLYCSDHRLETCGACCFNFRKLNLIAELGGAGESCAAAVHAERQIRLESKVPSRRAPAPGKPLVAPPAPATRFGA